MKQFFITLPLNIIACFKGRMLLWHVTAISLSVVLVLSGLDWRYFLATRSPLLRDWMFPAVHIGGLLPIVLPLALFVFGSLLQGGRGRIPGWAVSQAEVIGALIAAFYKALTGRTHPTRTVGDDLTHTFRFGFLRGGVFWGWPSSHTTIAFAMAAAIFELFPKQRWVGCVAILYALYVGIGVSMTIHWLSDFIAGALFGTMVGIVVGRRFRQSLQSQPMPAAPI